MVKDEEEEEKKTNAVVVEFEGSSPLKRLRSSHLPPIFAACPED
jgi:hypothetical protein